MSYQRYIRSDAADQTITQILNRETSVLLGVSAAAETLLRQLNIHTVFDLGVSTIFDNAARIVWSGDELDSEYRRFGRAPTSVIDSDLVRETPITELPYHDIEALIGVGPATGPWLTSELAVERIRDLALWPPYLAAKAIVLEAYNPGADLDIEPEAPKALLPRSGSFGTERFLYPANVMFEGDYEGDDGQPLNGVQFDITASPGVTFKKMRYGARLTYAHTWIPKQVAKGQLLHSLPLAPGESTNVAVVEWSNKVAAATRQTVSESERISSVNERTRAVGQISGAVAREFQSGSSVSGSQSASASGWISGGFPMSIGFASASANETVAHTHTVSTGERSVDSFLRQNINDSTHQVSSAVRGQRAAVVTEVSQRESEYLSTRTVTNYNHMHALTVQYYEVVQIYETQVRLHDYERCIFIPMTLLDFRDERNIFKYVSRLKAAALDEITRDALDGLMDSDQHNTLAFVAERVPMSLIETYFDIPIIGGVLQQHLMTNVNQWGSAIRARYRSLESQSLLVQPGQELPPMHTGLPFGLVLRDLKWKTTPSSRRAIQQVEIVMENGVTHTITRSASPNAPAHGINPGFPGGHSISFGAIREIRIIRNPNYQPPTPTPNRIPDVDDLLVDFKLGIGLGSQAEWLDCGFFDHPAAFNQPFLRVNTPQGIAQAADLLMEHQLYYSQQVWLRENPQTLIMQFAPFQMQMDNGEVINLVDHIAPVPVTVVGNYVVYRFSYEKDGFWQKWVRENIDFSRVEADEVPVPTGGVFAEAVLGRFNAAEKVDLTRFFNWIDSPPPGPPQIAALRANQQQPSQAGALASVEAPIVNIQTPVAMPDPSAALSALTTAELFRNMSGASNTANAGSLALQTSSAGSIDAMITAGDTYVGLLNTMASMFASVTSQQGLKSLSEIGSLLNEKRKLGEAGAAASAAIGGAASSNGASSNGPSGGNGSGGTGGGGGGGTATVPDRRTEIIGEILEDTIVGTVTDGRTRGSSTTEGTAPVATVEAPAVSGPGIVPAPSGPTILGDAVARPSLALLSAYLSQFENDARVPKGANDLFAYGGVRTAGLKLRHSILEHFLGGGAPLLRGGVYDLALLHSDDLPGVASLACHNVLRSFARGETGTTFEKMALPWQRTACGGPPALQPWVRYKAGVPSGSGLTEYSYTFTQGPTPVKQFFRDADSDEATCKRINGQRPTGFYKLFKAADLGTDDPGDWYHFFVTHTISSLFSQNQIADDENEWLEVLFGDFETTEHARFYTLAIFGALWGMRELLRDFHKQQDPPNHPAGMQHVYDGWLWANALGMLEGIGYGADANKDKPQDDVNRESKIHYQGAFAGIDRTIGVTNIVANGAPNWRWVVPKANTLVANIYDFMDQARTKFSQGNYLELMEFVVDFGDQLAAQLNLSQHVEMVLDFTGAQIGGPPAPATSLVLGQHVPASSESAASGALVAAILPGTPEHAALVTNTNPKIVHQNDPADDLMTPVLSACLDTLADLVEAEWPGFELRITSAWRQKPANATNKSLHWEARACDMNVIEDDPAVVAAGDHDGTKLGRLTQLAVDAGFTWVWYEDPFHVHASVQRA